MESPRPSNASPAEPVENDKCTPKPDVKRPSWFTPCKQLGLKRKSSSVTTPGSSKLSSISTPNSSFKSHRPVFVTPIKKNDLSGAKAVEEGRPKVSVQTPLLSVQDKTPSTPGKCEVEKSNAPVKTLIPSPYTKLTPIRYRPRPMLSMSAIISKSQSEAETLELEELTEETVEILRKRVKEKEERVSALKLTQMHKKKNNTDKLLQLTKKWRSGCQEALQQLLEKSKALGYQHTMTELLVQLRIPHDLVEYDPDLEDFKD